MKRHWILLAVAVMLFSFGCKQRVVTQPEAGQPQTQKETEAKAQREAEEAARKEAEQRAAKPAVDVAQVRSEDAETKQAEEVTGLFADILFDFDSYEVKDSFRPAVKSIAAWLAKNSGTKLSIEGHCDDRGTNEYNLALGERRAKAVKDFLVSLGVPSSRIEVISFGEEKPLCAEQTEECWAKNRRAHFVVLK